MRKHAMQVILTRPLQQQTVWAQGLQAHGMQVKSLPLIEVAATPDVQWPAGRAYQALMFVSSNAAEHFYKEKQPVAGIGYALNAINIIANQAPQPRLWATGPGTVAALTRAGVPAEQIDAPAHEAGQFDSEALWQCVQMQIKPGGQVLIVRGRDMGTPEASRDWLALQIEAAGGQAVSCVVYERRAPAFTPEQLQDAQRWLRDGSVWLFSSSQAVRHLPTYLDVSQARCVCTHERIAQAAFERGFTVVCTSRPVVTEVVASIKSWHEC